MCLHNILRRGMANPFTISEICLHLRSQEDIRNTYNIIFSAQKNCINLFWYAKSDIVTIILSKQIRNRRINCIANQHLFF